MIVLTVTCFVSPYPNPKIKPYTIINAILFWNLNFWLLYQRREAVVYILCVVILLFVGGEGIPRFSIKGVEMLYVGEIEP